jgi:hypothetical protein
MAPSSSFKISRTICRPFHGLTIVSNHCRSRRLTGQRLLWQKRPLLAKN